MPDINVKVEGVSGVVVSGGKVDIKYPDGSTSTSHSTTDVLLAMNLLAMTRLIEVLAGRNSG